MGTVLVIWVRVHRGDFNNNYSGSWSSPSQLLHPRLPVTPATDLTLRDDGQISKVACVLWGLDLVVPQTTKAHSLPGLNPRVFLILHLPFLSLV